LKSSGNRVRVTCAGYPATIIELTTERRRDGDAPNEMSFSRRPTRDSRDHATLALMRQPEHVVGERHPKSGYQRANKAQIFPPKRSLVCAGHVASCVNESREPRHRAQRKGHAPGLAAVMRNREDNQTAREAPEFDRNQNQPDRAPASRASCSNRVTPGAVGFLILSHPFDRPTGTGDRAAWKRCLRAQVCHCQCGRFPGRP
jgi:hypothetical protein